jgi:CcmD family protein
MGHFVACYLCVWTAVLLYVAHLGVSQVHLSRRIDRLERASQRREWSRRATARAA